MKVLLTPDYQTLLNIQEQNGVEILNYSFDVHPTKLKDLIEKFVKLNEDTPVITTNNIQALNLFSEDMILWGDKVHSTDVEYTLVPFWEAFSSFKGIGTGDVFCMYCNNPFPRSTNIAYKDTIHFKIPMTDE